jgi:hypothetical protein
MGRRALSPLQDRYGLSYPVTDADARVIVTIRPTAFVAVDGGMTEAQILRLGRRAE